MAAGNETGPHPPTSPFDWGLGNAREPDASVPPTPAVPADPVRAADAVPADAVPAEPAPVPVPAPLPGAVPADAVPAEPAPVPVPAPGPGPVPGAVPNAPPADSPADSPIDSLFGDHQFRDYEGEPMVGPLPTGLNPFAGGFAGGFAGTPAGAAPPTSADPSVITGRATPAPVPPRQPSAPFSKNQKLLFWIAGGVIALLVLAVLFVVGTKIPAATAPVAATKSATPKVSPSPTSTPPLTGQAAVGPHLWSDLRGGECVDPYTNPFELRYTVVDCAAPHPAQMVVRGTFPGAAAAYPGVEALQSQINLLCTAPGVIDFATAGAYSDIQVQASFAATTEEWTKGQHDYFCFVNRAASEPITGSVAGTPAK
jgi:hypothetical protein